MPFTNDLDRLREEYADRKTRLAGKDLYSLFYAPYQFAMQQRQRALIRTLKQLGITSLSSRRILEVGCGGGGVLLEYLSLGAEPENLFGIDLLHDRLVEARRRLPLAGIACADGQRLPFADRSFDLVLQYTAFSSILDDRIRQQMATDMLRVLRPDGAILWYDFWLNPTNPQTRGIRPAEIRQLFAGCRVALHKITLAPPIARHLVPLSWGAAALLESLRLLNSHYLAVIQIRK